MLFDYSNFSNEQTLLFYAFIGCFSNKVVLLNLNKLLLPDNDFELVWSQMSGFTFSIQCSESV